MHKANALGNINTLPSEYILRNQRIGFGQLLSNIFVSSLAVVLYVATPTPNTDSSALLI